MYTNDHRSHIFQDRFSSEDLRFREYLWLNFLVERLSRKVPDICGRAMPLGSQGKHWSYNLLAKHDGFFCTEVCTFATFYVTVVQNPCQDHFNIFHMTFVYEMFNLQSDRKFSSAWTGHVTNTSKQLMSPFK